MEAIVECCAGLDVHQATVVAAVLKGKASQRTSKQVRTFGTVTRDLLEMKEWLENQGCTHVGMESTGVYWMPVYVVLEGHFQLIVGNAHHIKNVPGRKTDVKDSEWIADLVRHGLIRSSFVPPKPIRDLRDLVRYRRKLAETRATESNRLHKLLETANIKLSSVISDVLGVSGRNMLEALIGGKDSPAQMANLAQGRMKSKISELAPSLEGTFDEHHRFVLRLQLRRLDEADRDLQELDAEIDRRLAPYREQHERLKQLPGVDNVVAASVIAELGVDMGVFPSDRHVSAWAGVCPGSHESAGKRRKTTARKGNVHLRTTLVQAACAASRKKDTYLKDKYHRLKSRLGAKKAQMAIAHKLLVSAYFMLKHGTDYNELGAEYLDQRNPRRVLASLVKRIQTLGYTVEVKPIQDLGADVPANQSIELPKAA